MGNVIPPDSLSELEIFDIAAKAAATARQERVDRAQVERLLEILELEESDEAAIAVTQAFILRQAFAARAEFGRRTAVILRDGLTKLKTKAKARKLLGLFKWMYDALDRARLDQLRSINSFEDFLNVFRA